MKVRSLVVLALVVACSKPALDDAPVPLAHDLATGKLANGLTYYVLPYKVPEHRAALWLVVHAGSAEEDADQHGIAHLVEHLAFAGTKRFPQASLISYLEHAGMQFGADINAGTTPDDTVYKLFVATDDPAVVTNGLSVLRDFAGNVMFDPAALDGERDVVTAERHERGERATRIIEQLLPRIAAGTPYARTAAGDPDTIDHASRDTVVRFYKDWYRPDLMAVIAVGDFDAASIEATIRAQFGDLAMPASPRPRPANPAPPPSLVTAVAHDPDVDVSTVSVAVRRPRAAMSSTRDLRRAFLDRLVENLLRLRFLSVSADPASPIGEVGIGHSRWIPVEDVIQISAYARDGRVDELVTALSHEIARIGVLGFTDTELVYAMNALGDELEHDANQLDSSMSVARDLQDVFEWNVRLDRHTQAHHRGLVMSSLDLDSVNARARAWISAGWRDVVAITNPTTPAPSEAQIRALAEAATTTPMAPLDHTLDTRELQVTDPPGSTSSTSRDGATGATTWRFDNGVTVIFKPTGFGDEMRFDGRMPGGSSLYSDAEYDQVQFGAQIAEASGVDDVDAVGVAARTPGITSHVYLDDTSVHITGSAPTSKFVLAMKLLHLQLTRPRRDERAFARWKARRLDYARRRASDPTLDLPQWFKDGSRRESRTTPELVDGVDLDTELALRRRALSDFGRLTVVIVGNEDTGIVELTAKHFLGSLPASGTTIAGDSRVHDRPGPAEKAIEASADPTASVQIRYATGHEIWSIDGFRDAKALELALRLRLYDVLRRGLTSVYSVDVQAELTARTGERQIEISFKCDPGAAETLRDAVFAEIAAIQKHGVSDETVAKVVEQTRREGELETKTNQFWITTLMTIAETHVEPDLLLDREARVSRITSDNLQQAARHFLDTPSRLVAIKKPRP
jgi:zinc protease